MQLKNFLPPDQDDGYDFVVPRIDDSSGLPTPNHCQRRDFILPFIKTIDLTSVRAELQRLNEAIANQNYQEAIKHATTAIEYQVVDLFDIRAFCYAMHGQQTLALSDAQRMIEYRPASLAGYLRKGSIFSLYGQQTLAMEALDQSPDTEEPALMELLAQAKEMMVNLNSARIDFITKLPADIAGNILFQLPHETVGTCLSISREWRQRTLECKKIWKDLTICDSTISIRLASTMPYTARHVHRLTIDSSCSNIRKTCFEYMQDGLFSDIKSLKITAIATQNLRPQLPTFSIALSTAKSTLTSLEIDFSNNDNPVTLADLLQGCRSATKLSYSIKAPMSIMIGDLSTLTKKHPLASLNLSSELITGLDIKVILEACQVIRRLVVTQCQDDKVIFDTITSNSQLEVFGCNYLGVISEIQQPATVNNRIVGLREIYVGHMISVKHVLPLLYHNMRTLQIISMEIPEVSQKQLQQIYETYMDLKFEKLTCLSVSMRSRGMLSFILQSVPVTSSLTILLLRKIKHFDEMVDALIDHPPPQELYLSPAENVQNGERLNQLFKQYAQVSTVIQPLRAINLQYCGSSITDDILASLAMVKTLEEISFCRIMSVTSDGLSQFLDHMKDQLTSISFSYIESVQNVHISAVGKFQRLKQLVLEGLPNITDQGIQGMLDGGSNSLKALRVRSCKSITEQCILNARKAVKSVVYRH